MEKMVSQQLAATTLLIKVVFHSSEFVIFHFHAVAACHSPQKWRKEKTLLLLITDTLRHLASGLHSSNKTHDEKGGMKDTQFPQVFCSETHIPSVGNRVNRCWVEVKGTHQMTLQIPLAC